MTLQDFFDLLSANPIILLFFFVCLPLTSFLAGVLGKGEANISPWKYLYSALIYLACVPGIFAIFLNIYLFLFERISIFDANIYTQILPIAVMLLTLWIIRKNTCYEDIPGFDKLAGLFVIISCVLAIMWILDRTHIFAFTYMPFYAVILMMVALFAVIRLGVRNMMS